MLWETARRRPHAEALVELTGLTGFAALAGRAGAVARALAAEGVRPGERVAIYLERGSEAAAAFFGALAAGAIAVNVNESLRTRQVDHILGHAGARVLLSTASLLARLPRPLATPVRVTEVATLPPAEAWTPVPRLGADPAHIIYTSGSTGLPKGVTVSHANLWAGMEAVAAYLGIGPEDRIASLLPFSFDYGLNQLLLAAGTGAALVVERSPLPQQIVATCRDAGVTVLPCVPPLWLSLIATRGFRDTRLPALRAMTNTGGGLPRAAVRALRAAQPQAELFLMYGLTEAFRSTWLPPSEVDHHPDSIGIAIPGAEILVLREDGTPCDPEEVGELVHRGPTVALGYWDDPAATARVFRSHPLRPPGTPDAERVVYSGDLVRRDAAGFLYHHGRRDALIKTLGFRVSPDEVAAALFGSGEVLEVAVTGEPDPRLGERIVAHVVLAPGGSLPRLSRWAGAELPRHLQPAHYEVHAQLPRTTSGKHDLKALATA